MSQTFLYDKLNIIPFDSGKIYKTTCSFMVSTPSSGTIDWNKYQIRIGLIGLNDPTQLDVANQRIITSGAASAESDIYKNCFFHSINVSGGGIVRDKWINAVGYTSNTKAVPIGNIVIGENGSEYPLGHPVNDPGKVYTNTNTSAKTTRYIAAIIVIENTNTTPIETLFDYIYIETLDTEISGDQIRTGTIIAGQQITVGATGEVIINSGNTSGNNYLVVNKNSQEMVRIGDLSANGTRYGIQVKNSAGDTVFNVDSSGEAMINNIQMGLNGKIYWSNITSGSLPNGFTMIGPDFLNTGHINADNITTGTIDANRISANSITADKISIGKGNNVANTLYSSWPSTGMLLYTSDFEASNCTIAEVLNGGVDGNGSSCWKMTSSISNALVYLSPVGDNYNITITPNRKWIFSVYVKSNHANATIHLRLQTPNGTYIGANFPLSTGAVANTWTRTYIYADMSLDNSAKCAAYIVSDNPGPAANREIYFDKIQIEEYIGNVAYIDLATPSAYSPPASTIISGNQITTGTLDASRITVKNLIIGGVAGSGNNVRLAQDDDLVVQTANYRNNNPPTNNPSSPIVSFAQSKDGAVLASISWTYTQGSLPADFISVYYKKGSSVAQTDPSIITDAATGTNTAVIQVEPNSVYSFGVQASRRTDSGIKSGAIQALLSQTSSSSIFGGEFQRDVPFYSGKKPSLICALKSNSDTTIAIINAKRIEALGYSIVYSSVASAFSVPLSGCNNYDIIVTDFYAWGVDAAANTFIKTAFESGKKILVFGNDSSNIAFYIKSTVGVASGQRGVSNQTSRKHVLHTGWSSIPADPDGGNLITEVVPEATVITSPASTAAANGVKPADVFILSNTNGGMIVHCQSLMNSTDAQTTTFLKNIIEYMAGNIISRADEFGYYGKYTALELQTSAANYNTSNDNDGTAIPDATVASDLTAIDHTINTDGTANISFEWSFPAASVPSIDGFQIFSYSSTASSGYTFGTSPTLETVNIAPATKNAYILYGAPANNYYKFGVRPYRIVNSTIASAGIITAPNIVSSTASAENPYQPSANVQFAGNVIGSIAGSSASTIVAWSASAYNGTANYRDTRAPNPTPSAPTLTQFQTSDGNIVVKATWAYTPSTPAADHLYFYTKEDGGTVVSSDPCITLSPSVSSINIIAKPNKTYSFALQAGRRTDSGTALTAMSTASSISTSGSNFNGLIGSLAASSITTAVNNFNTSNDFKTTRPEDPTFSSIPLSGILDWTQNTDGTAKVTFEWAYTEYTAGNDARDIDGFIIYIHDNGTTPPASTIDLSNPSNIVLVNYTDSTKRSIVYPSLPADHYYTFGVQAYRSVNTSIAASGILTSNIVKPTSITTGEFILGAWQPSASVSFTGDIWGTIDGNPVGISSSNLFTSLNNAANSIGSTYTQDSDPFPVKPTFSRASAAVLSTGETIGIDTPKIEQGKYGQAILLEESTNNLIGPDSDTFNTWTQYRTTTTSNAIQVPGAILGKMADKIVCSGTADPIIAKVITNSLNIANSTFTFSVWLWTDPGQPSEAQLYMYDGSVTKIQTQILTLTTSPKRYSITYTFPADTAGNIIAVRIDPVNAGTAGAYIYAWQAQLEEKHYPTSYTPVPRSADVLSIPTSSAQLSTTEGTFECWVNPRFSNPVNGMITSLFWPSSTKIYNNTLALQLRSDGASGLLVEIFNGYNTGYDYLNNQYPIELNKWTHVAITWKNGSPSKLYVNGVLVKTTLQNSAYLFSNTTYIGIAGTGPGAGLLDDVRISNKERSATEIWNNFSSSVPAQRDNNTTLLLPFDTTTTWTDTSASQNVTKSFDGVKWVTSATVGAPIGTFIGSYPVSAAEIAVTNYNTGNDMDNSTPIAPTLANDATTIDHTINTDMSADISFEWSFPASGESSIDGFQLFSYSSVSSSPYTFGTSPASETVVELPASKRAFIFMGVPADRYYTFGIRSYRSVHKSVASSGILLSSIVKSSYGSDNPYLPNGNIAFKGKITGTIDGVNRDIPVSDIHTAINYASNAGPKVYVQNTDPYGTTLSFTRNTQAYKEDGTLVGANLPRMEQGRFGQAIKIEEATTNIIPNADTLSSVIYPFYTIGATNDLGCNITNGVAELYMSRTVTAGSDRRIYLSTAATATVNQGYFAVDRSVTNVFSFDYRALGTNSSSVEVYFAGPAVSGSPSQQLSCCNISNIGILNASNFCTALQSTPLEDGFTRYAVSIPPAFWSGASTACNIFFGNGWGNLGTYHYLIRKPQLEQKTFNTSFINGSRQSETLTVDVSKVFSTTATGACLAGSIEFWANIKSTFGAAQYHVLATNGSYGATGFYLWTAGSILQLVIGNGTSGFSLNSSVAPSLGWHHYVVTWDQTKAVMYLDGAQVAINNQAFAPVFPNTFHLGNHVPSGGRYLNGLIDDFKTYNYAISATTVLNNYNKFTPAIKDAGCTLLLPFDTGDKWVDTTDPLHTIIRSYNGVGWVIGATDGVPSDRFIGSTLAGTIETNINAVVADDQFSQVEKQSIRKDWENFYKQYLVINSIPSSAFVQSSDKTDYTTAFQNLGNYLNTGAGTYTIGATPPLWITDAQLGTITSITASSFRSYFSAYADTYQKALKSLTDKAATIADWDNLIDAPLSQLYNNDDATTLGFNPTFALWSGAYPSGWTTWVGAAPTKSTSPDYVRVGKNAVKYTAVSSNLGMYCLSSFANSPIASGAIIQGSVDILMSQVVSGKPGMLLRVYKTAAISDSINGTDYDQLLIQPITSTATSAWEKVPFTFRQGNTPSKIYGIKVYIMASWTGFSSGPFTGTCYFDNFRLNISEQSQDVNIQRLRIDDISSDSSISQSEKQQLFLEWKTIYDEKISIFSQSASSKVTNLTEYTNYSNAYTTLANYLTGSPILIDTVPTTGNTWIANASSITITGSTFRNNFSSYYDAKQKLLNKIADVTFANKLNSTMDGAGSLVLGNNANIKSLTKNLDGSGKGLLYGVNSSGQTIFNVGDGAYGDTTKPHIAWSEAASALEVVGKINMGPGSTIDWTNVVGINDNLVTNSTFTNGTTIADGFNIYDNYGPVPTATIVTSGGVDGGSYQRIAWSASPSGEKGIYGNITTGAWKASSTYTISFYAKTSNLNGNHAMNLLWNTLPTGGQGQVAVLNPNLTASWQKYIFNITWGATVEASGRFYISLVWPGLIGAGNIEFDHLKIEEGSTATAWQDGIPSYIKGTKITSTTIESPTINAGSISGAIINAGTLNSGTINAAIINATAFTAATSQIAQGAVTTYISYSSQSSSPLSVTNASQWYEIINNCNIDLGASTPSGVLITFTTNITGISGGNTVWQFDIRRGGSSIKTVQYDIGNNVSPITVIIPYSDQGVTTGTNTYSVYVQRDSAATGSIKYTNISLLGGKR